MVKFEKVSVKQWKVFINNEEVKILNLDSSTITNKFNIVTEFIERLSISSGSNFDTWFIDFLEINNADIDKKILIISELKNLVFSYLEKLNINYDEFVNRKKAKKGSILFEPNEIESIIKTSNYLKIYSVIFNSNLKLPIEVNKKLYNILIEDMIENQVVSKILNVVKTKTYRYNISDAYMWEYLKNIHCKTIDSHADEIFNFIMNSIVVLCEESKNPITYFVGVVDESVKWFLRSIYKKAMIYDNEISTEDIHHTSSENNLKTYGFNDTLGKLKVISFNYVHKIIESADKLILSEDDSDKRINEFHNRLGEIKFVSPLSECIVFPILSQVTDIPYNYFSTVSPESSAILTAYINNILVLVFRGDYCDLFSLLDYYPTSQPAISTTYKLKNVNNSEGFFSINNGISFLCFNTKIKPYSLISYFIGRSSRVNFCNLYSGRKLTGIPLSKIELDMMKFYSLFFSGGLVDKIKEIRDIVYNDF